MTLLLSLLALLASLWSATASAQDEEAWLTLYGAGGLTWGSSEQPLDAVPRTRELYLPDAGFIGLTTRDKPDDLEVPAPPGERRFLRYVAGKLVDAWQVSQRPIPVTDFARIGDVEFTGSVLGPALGKDEDGWMAVGEATSWKIRDRTVLHWKDRVTRLEILISRASPSSGYGVRREVALAPGIPSKVKPTIKGDMNRWVKPRTGEISGCFDNSPKPVEAEVWVRWDAEGRLARIRATADQTAAELTPCVAGAIADLVALPNQEGSFTLLRLR